MFKKILKIALVQKAWKIQKHFVFYILSSRTDFQLAKWIKKYKTSKHEKGNGLQQVLKLLEYISAIFKRSIFSVCY